MSISGPIPVSGQHFPRLKIKMSKNSGLDTGKVEFTEENREILNLITVWIGSWYSSQTIATV